MNDEQPLPHMISRFEVTARLGQGGMADVFLGRLGGIGGFSKQVVIKRLLPELKVQPEFVQMFIDEARISASLSHPNIVQVFEIGESDGLPFLAMEFLNGPNVSMVVKRHRETGQPLDVGMATRIIRAVAGALAHAWAAVDEQGRPLHVVHRDVTPQNIVLTLEGAVKLVDFGVARAESRLSKTRTGVVKGKASYMAPEQVQAQPLDGRTDVYACGVCLYLLVTGKLPFRGDSEFAVMNAVVQGGFPAPRSIRADCPEALEAVILKAMAHNPADRYQSAQDLQAALNAFLAEHAPSADPQRDLREWVRNAVPDWEARLQRRLEEGRSSQSGASISWGPTPSGAYAVSGAELPVDLTMTSIAPSGGKKPAAGRWIAAFAVLGVAAALAVGGYLATRPSEPAPVVVVATPLPPAPEVRAGEADLDVYLPELERLVAAARFPQARDVLARARALKGGTAAQVLRLAELGTKLEVGERLASARRLSDEGNADEAVEMVKDALELDPQQPEALAMLEQLTRPAETAATAPARGQATLTVRATPDATIYVDDAPHGQTPLSKLQLPPGNHRLELRRDGYQPLRRTVKLTARRTTALSLTLVARADGAQPEKTSSAAALAAAPASADPGEASPSPATKVAAVTPSPVEAVPPAATEPQPDTPEVVKAPESATVAVAAPAPPPAVQQGPRPIAAPRLPASHTVRNSQELTRVLSIIEREISERGGVPARDASGVSVPLAERLIADFSPGSTIVLSPKGMYYLVVEGFRKGERKQAVAETLKRAHLDGSIRHAGPK